MHWALEKAQELISKHPDTDSFVCASGISPSGSIHVGNFREVVTTYFVVKSLRKLGKKVRFIFSWDDYDRLRKVPKNIDPSFEQYIGMPYAEIPDPFGCHSSYAEHFEREFEESLAVFGIEADFIYQSKEYKSGRYNQNILRALERRGEIYDILMQFKTQHATEEERENFFPITVYCQACKKDNTQVQSFDLLTSVVEYACQCGERATVNVLAATNIKLNWKIDWPMRWMTENVVFEPGGRDHSAETGSYNVSKVIAKEIFDYEAPDYVAYEFIGIKGSNGKMSSSAGNTITPSELLKIYVPELILFIFSKYRPGAAFNIGLDEDVLRNYSEYDRLKTSYRAGRLKEDDLSYSLGLVEMSDDLDRTPKFNQLAGVLPLVNFDVHILQDVLAKVGVNHTIAEIAAVSQRVEYWIKNWYPENMIYLNTAPDQEYYSTLDEREKGWLKGLCEIVRNSANWSDDEVLQAVYDLCHDEDKKVKKNNQKILFAHIYRLVLNNDSGPRLPLLIKTVGIDKILALLDF